MRDYFKRLKEHSGLSTATMLTLVGTLAGASNENFQDPIEGALFGFIVMGLIVWSMVFISNFKK